MKTYPEAWQQFERLWLALPDHVPAMLPMCLGQDERPLTEIMGTLIAAHPRMAALLLASAANLFIGISRETAAAKESK